jgi:hypothetical protein
MSKQGKKKKFRNPLSAVARQQRVERRAASKARQRINNIIAASRQHVIKVIGEQWLELCAEEGEHSVRIEGMDGDIRNLTFSGEMTTPEGDRMHVGVMLALNIRPAEPVTATSTEDADPQPDDPNIPTHCDHGVSLDDECEECDPTNITPISDDGESEEKE